MMRPSLLVAGLIVVTLTGCVDVDTTDPPTSSPTSSASASASATPSPGPTGTEARAVYYVRDTGRTGPRLYREFHARPPTDDPVRDAVEAMLGVPPDDADYTSLWPAGVEVRDASVDGDTATVDLSEQAASGSAGAAFEAISIQQLVHTVTAAEPSVRRVQLLVEGERRETLWGHVDVREPIAREPQEDVLGPVWILTPTEGGSLARGAEFGGVATVFEATVSWQWVQDGSVVAEGFSTATEGAPGRGDWAGTVDVAPGEYELRAYAESAEDGSETFLDTKIVTVTG